MLTLYSYPELFGVADDVALPCHSRRRRQMRWYMGIRTRAVLATAMLMTAMRPLSAEDMPTFKVISPIFSQLVAFFLWYQGLALGGVVRISQVQLVQPFLTLGISAALLGEVGIPQKVMRGVAVVSRSAGLVGHIHEESQQPSAAFIWETVDEAIPFKE